MNTYLYRMRFGLVIGLSLFLGGCNILQYGQYVISSDTPTVLVKAEYCRLENERVAVLADVPIGVLYSFPGARLNLCEVVSTELSKRISGIYVVPAKQIIGFQRRNIYWNTKTYSQLAGELGVTRIILLEVSSYRTHEPGSADLYRGVIASSVGVAETDGSRPNDMAYRSIVSVSFPEYTSLPIPNTTSATVEKEMLKMFGAKVVGKFADHKEERE